MPDQALIHIHPDPSELGRVFRPEIAVAARAAAVVRQLAQRAEPPSADRGGQVRSARAEYEAWQELQETPGDVKLERIVAHLNRTLPDDAIVTNGAGNYSAWLHRYYRYRTFRTQLAPTSGSMGYGLPAAIAAKLRHPDREVICLAGDGCFQMVSQEFATACEHGAAVIVLIANNGMYGTIRMHQERQYPGRVSGTSVQNPDFAALARAHGGFGAVVTEGTDFPEAFDEARASGLPSVIELRVSPRALTPRLVLSD